MVLGISAVVDFRFHTESTGRRAIGIDITGIEQREKFEVTESCGRVGGDVRFGIKRPVDNTRGVGGSSIRIVLLFLIDPRMFGNLARPRDIIRILITTPNVDFGLHHLTIAILGGPNKILPRTNRWCFVLLAVLPGHPMSGGSGVRRHHK